MKIFIKSVTIVVTLVILGIFGCQKNLNEEKFGNTTFKTKDGFLLKGVFDWYTQNYPQGSRQLKNNILEKDVILWQEGVHYKIGKNEVVEIPLLKNKSSFIIRNNPAQSEVDRKKIANSSISKIVFTIDENNKITIKEIDLIPDLEYLIAKNYDVSSLSYYNKNRDFSGSVAIISWDGVLLEHKILENGITTKIGKRVDKQASVSTNFGEGCQTVTYCIFERECDVYGDGLVTNCSPWENTGDCWDEPVCPGGGNVDGGGYNAEDNGVYGDPIDADGYKPFTSGNFRYNLGVKTGQTPPSGKDAHHIFPQAPALAPKFLVAGIDINDPKYGVWWATPGHQQYATAYNSAWDTWFNSNPNPTSSQILAEGRIIMSSFGFTQLNY